MPTPRCSPRSSFLWALFGGALATPHLRNGIRSSDTVVRNFCIT